MILSEALPNLSTEFTDALRAIKEEDLADQIGIAEINYYTFDPSCNATYIYLLPTRELNVVETNIIGVKHGGTISLEHNPLILIDVDNFNRLAGIELLNSKDVADKLSEIHVSKHPW